jgi:hypothetical protein
MKSMMTGEYHWRPGSAGDVTSRSLFNAAVESPALGPSSDITICLAPGISSTPEMRDGKVLLYTIVLQIGQPPYNEEEEDSEEEFSPFPQIFFKITVPQGMQTQINIPTRMLSLSIVINDYS